VYFVNYSFNFYCQLIYYYGSYVLMIIIDFNLFESLINYFFKHFIKYFTIYFQFILKFILFELLHQTLIKILYFEDGFKS